MAYSETLFSINSKARLPLFQAFNHPLALPTAKRTFVMFLDTSPAGMKECLGIERNLEIPFAHFNDLQAIGITTLGPNDAFLAACTRINEAKLRTLLEVPKMWIIGREDFTQDQAEELVAAQKEFLGAFELRTNGAPTIEPLTKYRVGGGPEVEREAEDIEQLGSSGGTHFDAFDLSRAFTSVNSVPDLSDGMDPGSLFFLLAGICVRLDPYVTINLSTLHFHEGTPLVVPRGIKLKGWEMRCNSVNYLPKSTLEGEARYPVVAALDNKAGIFTTTEMRLPDKYADQRGQIERDLYDMEGLSLTNANAYTEFSGGELASLIKFNVMQMDKRIDARLDIEAFIKSLSFEFDGTRSTRR